MQQIFIFNLFSKALLMWTKFNSLKPEDTHIVLFGQRNPNLVRYLAELDYQTVTKVDSWKQLYYWSTLPDAFPILIIDQEIENQQQLEQ